MSIKIMDMVADRVVGGQTEKGVLGALANYANDYGEDIWASNTTIADRIGIRRETAARALKALKKRGLIVAVGQRKSGMTFTVIYSIDLKKIASLDLTETAEKHQEYIRKSDVTLNHNGQKRCDSDGVSDVTEGHTNCPRTALKKYIKKFWEVYPSTPHRKRGRTERLLSELSEQQVKQVVSSARTYAKHIKTHPNEFVVTPQNFIAEEIYKDYSGGGDQSKVIALPKPGTQEHGLRQTIIHHHSEQEWRLWFSDTQVLVDYPRVIPRTRYVADNMPDKFGAALAAAGLHMGEFQQRKTA